MILNLFLNYVPKILCHQRIASKQKEFIQNIREHVILENRTAVSVQVDFGQNYSFIVQDATQGFHWNNQQCTLHPFVVHYFRPTAAASEYKAYFAISDCLDHDANTFHFFRKRFVELLKEDCIIWGINLKKLFYVSDGAASQYKNYKNYANLVKHVEDFELEAEWHFTAT
jgi:hypothetical protein